MAKIKRKIVSITKKGQTTLQKEKLIKSLPSVAEEMGSLKKLFTGKTAKELVLEARKEP